jgi:hypothetical protein
VYPLDRLDGPLSRSGRRGEEKHLQCLELNLGHEVEGKEQYRAEISDRFSSKGELR